MYHDSFSQASNVVFVDSWPCQRYMYLSIINQSRECMHIVDKLLAVCTFRHFAEMDHGYG